MAIPYKMLFSVEKISKHPVLGPIIEEHQEVFIDDENEGRKDELIMTLGIAYEMSLG
jgi:hypothetical protein|tara:strand:+ start:306 stop:476 length:171 start_codon:yes stop_codon:yes gene_type:complete